MSKTVGRFFIICTALAVALFLAYKLALRSPNVQLGLFERAAATSLSRAAPSTPQLDAITVRPCIKSGCTLVQASGRNFLFGAGEGAAHSLFLMGSLNAELDGVMLPDLSREQIEGLLAVRDRTLEAGRRDMLKVYGPSGVERVVDGVNAMLETSDADRAIRYSEGLLPFSTAPVEIADMGGYEDGAVVFDSGVLVVRAFNVTSGRAGSDALIYRFDQQGQTLIIGGCRARLEDVRLALEDGPVEDWALVLPLSSERMLGVLQGQVDAAGLGRESRFIAASADECLTIDGMAEVLDELKGRALFWPLYPSPATAMEQRLWRSETAELAKAAAQFEVGGPQSTFVIDGTRQRLADVDLELRP